MIYISENQFKDVEYLLLQSTVGNHLLFDEDSVRAAFSRDHTITLDPKECYAVEHHIERMIQQPGLPQMRAYFENLDNETRTQVVRTYFNIVENHLIERQVTRH